MAELNRLSPDQFKESEKLNLSIILDDVRSMANVGSIFRTADCFRIKKIYITGISPCPPHREIEKTALGATDSVEWEYFENVLELIETLNKKNVLVLSLEQTNESVSLLDFMPSVENEYALVLGNEVFGVKDEVIRKSNHSIEIPQFGTKHSFNVSVSNAIFMWDFYSKISKSIIR